MTYSKTYSFALSVVYFCFYCGVTGNLSSLKPNKQRLNECGSCKVLAKSLDYWLKQTWQGKFEGEDVDWDVVEVKSEMRLLKIQQGLCSEQNKYKDECYVFAYQTEHLMELWWKEHDPAAADFHTWLCIDSLQLCCPQGHFGPQCLKCPTACGEYGRCDGNGTRGGTGKCACARGRRLVNGWCAAVDPCHEDACAPNKLCVVREGARECVQCDKACKTCTGPGRTECGECAPNHIKSYTGACINTHSPDHKQFQVHYYILLPLGFVCLQIISNYCKSKYFYLFVFEIIFVAVHYYYGYIHMLCELVYDFLEYMNVFSIFGLCNFF